MTKIRNRLSPVIAIVLLACAGSPQPRPLTADAADQKAELADRVQAVRAASDQTAVALAELEDYVDQLPDTDPETPPPTPEPEPTPEPTPEPKPAPETPGLSLYPAVDLGGPRGVLDYSADGMAVNLGLPQGDVTTYAGAIEAAGFRWVRTRLLRSDIEQGGRFDWTRGPNYDRIADEFNGRGIGVLFMMQVSGSYPTATERQAFASFAASAAKHFAGRKVMFELGNETNIPNFWPMPKPPTTAQRLQAADQYSALAAVVVPAMRAADPNVFVTGPGLAGRGGNAEQAQLYFQRLKDNGTHDLLDDLSVHPYVAERDSPSENMPTGKVPEEGDHAALVAIAGLGRVLNSENGWRSDGSARQDKLQAGYNIRDYIWGLWHNIRLRVWYVWNQTAGMQAFWIAGKPASQATRVLSDQLAGLRLLRRVDTGNPQQFVFEFADSAGVQLLVMWRRDWTQAERFSYPSTRDAELVDTFGATSALASNNGSLPLWMSIYPTYVRLR